MHSHNEKRVERGDEQDEFRTDADEDPVVLVTTRPDDPDELAEEAVEVLEEAGIGAEATNAGEIVDEAVHRTIASFPISSGGADLSISSGRVEPVEVPDEAEGLTDVAGIGAQTAEELYGAGYESVRDLEEAGQTELTDLDSIGPALAARIKADVGDP